MMQFSVHLNSQSNFTKWRKHENTLFGSGVLISNGNSNSLGGNFGAEWIYHIPRLVEIKPKNASTYLASKPIFLSIRPFLSMEKPMMAYLGSSFSVSLFNRDYRTGPFSFYMHERMNVGIVMQKDMVLENAWLGGPQFMYRIYLPKTNGKRKAINFHIGIQYLFGWNAKGKELSGLRLSFAFRYRTSKIAWGGF